MRVLVNLYMYPKKTSIINEFHVLCDLFSHFMYKSIMIVLFKFLK
jgi:hypothetical protein